jgi:hypothetical protein
MNINYLKDHYGDNYVAKARAEYTFNGKGGRIISMNAAKILYDSFCKWIDEGTLDVSEAVNLILHNKVEGAADYELAAIQEWNDAIIKQDRYAISTNFSLIMSCADSSLISMEIGQVDNYKPDAVIRNAISDAAQRLRSVKEATSMIKALSLNISKNGYSSSVGNDFIRGNDIAQYLFKKWNEEKNPGDNKVTIQRLLDSSIFYRIHQKDEGFLFKKGFSKYWFAGFGFVFISDSNIYYNILGSSMRNALMSSNRKVKGVSMISLLQSALRQRIAVCNNQQNVIGYDRINDNIYKGQAGVGDVNVAPLSLMSFKDFFEADKENKLSFIDGFSTYGKMDWDERDVLDQLDERQKRRRRKANEYDNE